MSQNSRTKTPFEFGIVPRLLFYCIALFDNEQTLLKPTAYHRFQAVFPPFSLATYLRLSQRSLHIMMSK